MPFGILITKGLFSASASINTRRYRIFPYLKATTTALSGTVKSALMSSADKLLFISAMLSATRPLLVQFGGIKSENQKKGIIWRKKSLF